MRSSPLLTLLLDLFPSLPKLSGRRLTGIRTLSMMRALSTTGSAEAVDMVRVLLLSVSLILNSWRGCESYRYHNHELAGGILSAVQTIILTTAPFNVFDCQLGPRQWLRGRSNSSHSW